MHQLLQAAMLAAATALLCVLLRSIKPEFAFLTGSAGGVCVLLLALAPIREIAQALRGLSISGQIGEIAQLCLRAASVVLVCECTAAFCRAGGEEFLAGRIEFFGRVLMCAMCVPVMLSFVDLASSFSFFG